VAATSGPPLEPDATQATPVAAATPAATTTDRPVGIFIPKWVGLVAAAIIAALIFGGIGYAIGDSSSGSSNERNASAFPGAVNGNGPFGNGRLPGGYGGQFGDGQQGQVPNGNGNGAGNGQATGNGGFLGVALGNADNGVQVTEVASGSPAANAGLKQGDVITAVDGTKVTTPQELSSAVQQHASGDQITVTYTRDGKSTTVNVTLTSRSTQSS
jgi:putative serine protease PepD